MIQDMVAQHSLQEALGQFTTQRLLPPPTSNLVFHTTTSLQADQVGVPPQLGINLLQVEGKFVLVFKV